MTLDTNKTTTIMPIVIIFLSNFFKVRNKKNYNP